MENQIMATKNISNPMMPFFNPYVMDPMLLGMSIPMGNPGNNSFKK
jgi:hypothetical protein